MAPTPRRARRQRADASGGRGGRAIRGGAGDLCVIAGHPGEGLVAPYGREGVLLDARAAADFLARVCRLDLLARPKAQDYVRIRALAQQAAHGQALRGVHGDDEAAGGEFREHLGDVDAVCRAVAVARREHLRLVQVVEDREADQPRGRRAHEVAQDAATHHRLEEVADAGEGGEVERAEELEREIELRRLREAELQPAQVGEHGGRVAAVAGVERQPVELRVQVRAEVDAVHDQRNSHAPCHLRRPTLSPKPRPRAPAACSGTRKGFARFPREERRVLRG
jgi:hypothetical protein